MPKFYVYASQALFHALVDRGEADYAGVCVICVPLKGWCCVPSSGMSRNG